MQTNLRLWSCGFDTYMITEAVLASASWPTRTGHRRTSPPAQLKLRTHKASERSPRPPEPDCPVRAQAELQFRTIRIPQGHGERGTGLS
jgi:hypothetical protein